MMKKETLRLSNSLNLSDRLYDICKSGWITKRSQNKKLLTPTNYKTRWFELTKYFLYYFDVENVEVSLFFYILHFIIFFHFPHFVTYSLLFIWVRGSWSANDWKRKGEKCNQAGRQDANQLIKLTHNCIVRTFICSTIIREFFYLWPYI